MRKLCLILIAISLVTSLVFASCAAPTPTPTPTPTPSPTPSPSPTPTPTPTPTSSPSPTSKPVEISYVTFLPRMQLSAQLVIEVLAEIEKRSNGQLVFKYRGGPEAIPPFDQVMATKTGVVDMVFDPAGYNLGLVAAPAMINIAEISAYQDRETGAFDFLVEMHSKVGLRYLARAASPPGEQFSIVTKKRVAKPQEMAGLRINGGAIWEAVGPSLGMKTVALEIGDVYIALERGVIDAAGSGSTTLQGMKVWEVAKYLINPPFFSDSAVLLMNLNKWNTIPKPLQDLIVNSLFELEKSVWEPKNGAAGNAARKAMVDSGAEAVTFAGADAEYYINTITKAVYDYYAQRSPVDGPKLYSLLKKDALNK